MHPLVKGALLHPYPENVGRGCAVEIFTAHYFELTIMCPIPSFICNVQKDESMKVKNYCKQCTHCNQCLINRLLLRQAKNSSNLLYAG